MNDAKEAIAILADSFIPLMLGAGAAIARIGRHGWLGFAHFCREFILGCFYGLVMYWLLDLVDVLLSVKFGMTGGGVICLLELGDTIFERAKTLIRNFELADILPWIMRKKNDEGSKR